jgi:hypothetical protein
MRQVGVLLIVALGLSLARCGSDSLCPDVQVPDQNPLDTLRLSVRIEEIKAAMPGRDSNGYQAPTEAERIRFGRAVGLVVADSVAMADSVLDALGYDVTRMLEVKSGDTLVILEERVPVERGWGTYVLNESTAEAFDIHVNHPVYDVNTHTVGTALYIEARARWLLVAGTHRYANEGEKSDMARRWDSIFQTVHMLVASSGSIALSVHGFTPDYHSPPIETTDVILSNGRTTAGHWEATESAIALRNLLRGAGWSAGLAAYDDGYEELSGGVNPQGQFSNNTFGQGRWIHVEIARPIRDDPSICSNLIGIVAAWLSSLPLPPAPI